MHKSKLGTLTVGTINSNFKQTVEKFVARDNAFMSSVKGPPAYWKQFLYGALPKVK